MIHRIAIAVAAILASTFAAGCTTPVRPDLIVVESWSVSGDFQVDLSVAGMEIDLFSNPSCEWVVEEGSGVESECEAPVCISVLGFTQCLNQE